MKRPGNYILLVCSFCSWISLNSQDHYRLLHVSFDTAESISGAGFRIHGLAKYVPGVRGTAKKFDGFSSYAEGLPVTEGAAEPALPRSLRVVDPSMALAC